MVQADSLTLQLHAFMCKQSQALCSSKHASKGLCHITRDCTEGTSTAVRLGLTSYDRCNSDLICADSSSGLCHMLPTCNVSWQRLGHKVLQVWAVL